MLQSAQSPDALLAECASLDKLSPVPLYHQLRVLLQQKIESGLLEPNVRLPSEDAIASRCGRRCWIWNMPVLLSAIRGGEHSSRVNACSRGHANSPASPAKCACAGSHLRRRFSNSAS